MDDIKGPVKSAVDTPAAPHENPLDFRAWFCSFRLLPAQTNVIGAVIWGNSDNICLKFKTSGHWTNLDLLG